MVEFLSLMRLHFLDYISGSQPFFDLLPPFWQYKFLAMPFIFVILWYLLYRCCIESLPQLSSAQRRFGPPTLKMMFVCSQCWKNGQLSEADKNRKYCSAKARHTWVHQGYPCKLTFIMAVQFFTKALLCCFRWAKDKRVVLVSSHERKKWTIVRPLPTKKPVPAQFEVCQMFTRLQMASFALKTNFIVWLTTASLFPSLRFACTWQLGRSVSTSEIAHLRTAEKKEIFGLIWRNTTVSIQFCWTDLF